MWEANEAEQESGTFKHRSVRIRAHPATTELISRIARIVLTGLAHYSTQRGNGPPAGLFDGADHHLYLDLLRGNAAHAGLSPGQAADAARIRSGDSSRVDRTNRISLRSGSVFECTVPGCLGLPGLLTGAKESYCFIIGLASPDLPCKLRRAQSRFSGVSLTSLLIRNNSARINGSD